MSEQCAKEARLVEEEERDRNAARLDHQLDWDAADKRHANAQHARQVLDGQFRTIAEAFDQLCDHVRPLELQSEHGRVQANDQEAEHDNALDGGEEGQDHVPELRVVHVSPQMSQHGVHGHSVGRAKVLWRASSWYSKSLFFYN